MEKNFKQQIMSALYMTEGTNGPSNEAIKWAESHLPNDNKLGNNTLKGASLIAHLWDDFKGFGKSSRYRVDEHTTAVGIPTNLIADISKKMIDAAKEDESRGVVAENADETTILKLTRNMTQEEFAVIVINGIGSLAQGIKEMQKEDLWRRQQNGEL